jgi:hypothetical protein
MFLRSFVSCMQNLFHRRALDRRLDEELHFHLA